MTIALYVTEEMCARMGVVTGKGLSDLIREEFGFRPTFFVMVAGLLVDLGNVVAEFAGVAAAMEIFHVSKYISVPHRRADCLVSGSERHLPPGGKISSWSPAASIVTYMISAVLAKPDWLLAAKDTVDPQHPFQLRLSADAHRL